jgi:uncharacterized protein
MNKILRGGVAFLAMVLCLGGAVCAQEKPSDDPAKPKVRTITAFINVDRTRYQIDFSETVKFLKYARTVYQSRGYEVQTLRVATQPFPEYTKGMTREEAIQFFKNIDAVAQQENLLIAIGPAFESGEDGDAQADLLAEILRNTKSIQGSLMVTKGGEINWTAVAAAARVIRRLADTTELGGGTFRFAAIASMPPYSPFFPAAYHTGAGHQFAVGMESANTVAVAFQDAADYPAAKRKLGDLLFQEASEVENLARRADREQGWSYTGIDFSPAPMKDVSIGAAIEELSKAPFGASGTMTAVGTITSAIKDIGLRKTGYSGMMFPVMEDSRIAQRWNEGVVSMDALLSYSAVCATGLDTIPLPGDVSVETLGKIIGDVATLSVKWNKPLTARLMPAPGKHAGEMATFNNPSLIDVKIQPLTGTGVTAAPAQ